MALPEICFSSRVPVLPLLGKWIVHLLPIYVGRNLAVIAHLFSFNFISSELPNYQFASQIQLESIPFLSGIFLISFAASDVLIIYPEFSGNSDQIQSRFVTLCFGGTADILEFLSINILRRSFPSSMRYSIIYILLLSLVVSILQQLPNTLPILLHRRGKYL